MNWGHYLELALSAISGLWIGGFLTSYMKKKGENRAIQEDLKEAVEQMKAVTQATKEIESKISGDLWDRQKQWELKREILFEAAKRISAVDNALFSLHTCWKISYSGFSEMNRLTIQNEYITAWRGAMSSFEEGETLIQVACSRDATGKAFAELTDLLRETASRITDGDVAFYDQTKSKRNRAFAIAKVAIRKELGIPLNIAPQSNNLAD